MQKIDNDPVEIAKNMMSSHGLRASAVAQERAHEAELASDAAGLNRWRAVQAAIAELRAA